MSENNRTLPENHYSDPLFKYRENEFDTTCGDCGAEIGVVMPAKLVKWADDHGGDDSKFQSYLYEDYQHYCPECKKESGRWKEKC